MCSVSIVTSTLVQEDLRSGIPALRQSAPKTDSNGSTLLRRSTTGVSFATTAALHLKAANLWSTTWWKPTQTPCTRGGSPRPISAPGSNTNRQWTGPMATKAAVSFRSRALKRQETSQIFPTPKIWNEQSLPMLLRSQFHST